MAVPKIFISSTCYDLYEIRDNLRLFIKDFGYEPVMSEFSDIFYAPDQHVQDACLTVIPNCNMFILIIGNKYGNFYYKEHNKQNQKIVPDSVTLQEFKKAIQSSVPKIIFINKFVLHDYKNYRRFLDKSYTDYFKENTVLEDQITITKSNIKDDIDDQYPFAEVSYRYVFHFLDQIYDLEVGNSYHDFENAEDIRRICKQQWSGYLEQALTSFKNKPIVQQNHSFEQKSFERLEHLAKLITTLADDLKGKTSLDAEFTDFIEIADSNQLIEQQELLAQCIKDILYFECEDYFNEIHEHRPRVEFIQRVTEDQIKAWFNGLSAVINSYKWSKFISTQIVFTNFSYNNYQEWDDCINISIVALMKLANIFEKASENDKASIVNEVLQQFSKLEDKETIERMLSIMNNDDIPF